MEELILASQNNHKRDEIAAILGGKLKIITLRDLSYTDELAEDYNTLKENALQKCRFIYDRYKKDCFAEDSGLEVDSLNGAPGVKSARYAGEEKTSKDNIELLLKNLEGSQNRTARFRTVIALHYNGVEHFFEGTCEGTITTQPQGASGFGYDPVFIPNGYDKTFAELDSSVKNKISHRAKAMEQLKAFFVSK